jgi:hypothetical protein
VSVDPNRLGGVPVMLGVVGVNGVTAGPRMLGGVPTIGAAPLEGLPTLPMGLPVMVEMEGAAPTAGAPAGAAGACAKAAADWISSATANVRLSMGVSFLHRLAMQGPFRQPLESPQAGHTLMPKENMVPTVFGHGEFHRCVSAQR